MVTEHIVTLSDRTVLLTMNVVWTIYWDARSMPISRNHLLIRNEWSSNDHYKLNCSFLGNHTNNKWTIQTELAINMSDSWTEYSERDSMEAIEVKGNSWPIQVWVCIAHCANQKMKTNIQLNCWNPYRWRSMTVISIFVWNMNFNSSAIPMITRSVRDEILTLNTSALWFHSGRARDD